MVFHLYFFYRNFLASFSWDWDRIYLSMLWWIYRSLTYILNWDEIAWVLIGSLGFSVVISSVYILSFASIINFNSWVLSSWCPRTYCIVNYLGMRWSMSWSASFSVSLWRPWWWKFSSRGQVSLFTYASLSHVDRHWFWMDMLWYSEYNCRNSTAARDIYISAR